MTAVDESYNLSYSELQGLRGRTRENAKGKGQRDGWMTDRDGQIDGRRWTDRRTDRDMDEQRQANIRISLAPKHKHYNALQAERRGGS